MLIYSLTQFFVLRALLVEASFKNHPKSRIGESQLKSGYIDGDLIIGALFPVHEQPLLYDNEGGSLGCGTIRERYGIQRVEAALFAIDSINNDTDLLPGIRLGINIKDGCWSESVVLHQTLSLIEEPSLSNKESSESSGTCNQKPSNVSPLIGIIGPASSSNSILVQNILKLFQIPQIGYSATTPELANTALYPYYLRVVPSDQFQNKLIIQMLKTFKWTYVSVVYTDAMYGQNAVTDFRRNIVGQLCVADYKSLDPVAKEEDFDRVIRMLNQNEKANVIVCYCEGATVTGLLNAIRKANLTGRFMFIGSDAWSSRTNIVDGFSAEAQGSITVGIQETIRREFDEYFLQLNPKNNQRNPWFEEFWEYRFDCSMDPTDVDWPTCNGTENLREEYEQDSKVDYVMKSVYAMAHGLHEMHKDACKNQTGACKTLRKNFNTTLFWNYLVNTNFSYYNEYVNFHSTGEPWKVNYNIYNYQQKSDGVYEYVKIGRYYKIDEYEELEFFKEVAIQYPGGNQMKSVCSEPCPFGSAKIVSKGNQDQFCCWSCVACLPHEILVNESTCVECSEGFWPNKNQTRCEETSLKIVLFTFSCFGITVTLIATIIFIRYQNTPVVKSSTRELCYLMLIGMMMAHSIVFAIKTEPTFLTCVVVRTLPAISFSIIYASLLVKTNRIARILAMSKKKFPNLKPRFMTLTAQLTLTFTLITIQVVICVVMLIKEPPVQENISENLGFLICSTNVRVILFPFVFVGFLVIMCTLYAVKTRNLPDNFNEAKFIGFSMYVTCITWVAFGLIYFGSRLKIMTLCICSSTNALVILFFLFFPKLYIILCRPERNTRANFTTTKGIRCTIAVSQDSKNKAKKNSKPLLGKEFKNIIKLKKNKNADRPCCDGSEVEKLDNSNV